VSEPPAFPRNADDHAALVYDELRRIAASYMRRERGQTLQATALVNEAYMRLAGAPFTDRNHFIGVAARSMRQVLVDRARARGAHKRWAGLNRVSLTDSLVRADSEETMLPALDEALTRLEAADPELARIVELRYFVGLSIEDAADRTEVVMGVRPGAGFLSLEFRDWECSRASVHHQDLDFLLDLETTSRSNFPRNSCNCFKVKKSLVRTS